MADDIPEIVRKHGFWPAVDADFAELAKLLNRRPKYGAALVRLIATASCWTVEHKEEWAPYNERQMQE